MKKTYYHGTSIQNAKQILKDRKIKTNRLGYVLLCESINDCKTYYQIQNLPYLLEEESQKEMAYFALVLDDESVIDNDESCIYAKGFAYNKDIDLSHCIDTGSINWTTGNILMRNNEVYAFRKEVQ